MPLNRRHFVRQSGLFAASALSFPHIAPSVQGALPRPGQRPGRIIHFVSDGMSIGTLTCSDYLSQLARKRGLTFMKLFQDRSAQSAWVNMRSLNSIVTDSAAASSSWGCGSRVMNGVLNVLPDGRNLRTLYQLFGEAGWKRGLVTTTEITHATPAGFAANQSSRGDAEEIAVQYLERNIEVLLGGGRKFFDPAQRKDKQDLRARYAAHGYTIAQTLSELAAAPNQQPLLGIFSESHLPFSLDHKSDPKLLAAVPTLAQMTEAALVRLARRDRFILQVEGGRVDHGCHSCDAAAAFYDQIAFDEALDVCLNFQKRAPDTLIVITTDHGNGNPGLNGMGKDYGDSSPLFANLQKVKHSFGIILDRLGKAANEQDASTILKEETGYEASVDKVAQLLPFLHKKGKALYESMNSDTAQLGQLLANYLGIGWTSGAHTGDYVPLIALGPGAERFRGFIDNTDVFKQYLALARIDFRNPEVPLVAENGRSATAVESTQSYLA
jgi:alkaline phosphatase